MPEDRFVEIAETLQIIRQAVAMFPQLRLCQLIVNATGQNDPFYVTDEKLREDLRKYMTQYGGAQ